jgi:hypothetical protein
MPDEPAPLRRYYTRTQICELYQFSTRTFDRMLAAGKIPPPDKKFGDTRLWSSESVEAMGNSNLDAPSRRRLHLKPVDLTAAEPATDPPGRRGRRPKSAGRVEP